MEVLRIKDCSIRKCYTNFPASLKVLEISYCGLDDFAPSGFGYLAEVDLAFNKLKEIPKCLRRIVEENPSVRVNLRNNDLWYTMYSDLSPSLICPETVEELHLASKLNLVATSKLIYAVEILKQNNYLEAARELNARIHERIEGNKSNASNVSHNKENVHLSSIQGTTEEAIRWVMGYRSLRAVSKEAMLKELACDGAQELCDAAVVHPVYNTDFCALLMKVCQIACDSPHKEGIFEVLRQEISDGKDTCLTGQMTRLVNALSGFVADVKVSISAKEEMSNSIIALRKKYAVMYGNDSEMYVQEAVPAVWQLLEDCCVPEHEQAAWLEYV